MPMPKPIPVLIEDSLFFTTAVIASRCSGFILPDATKLPINSSMASHRLAACKSAFICSGLNMSPRSIEQIRFVVSPESIGYCKRESGDELTEVYNGGPPDLSHEHGAER